MWRCVMAVLVLGSFGCNKADDSSANQAASAGLGAAGGDSVEPRSAEARSAEANGKVYAATLQGACEHFVACECEAVTVAECVETMTGQTGGQQLPGSLYSCLNRLECDDLCADSSTGVARCTEAASALILENANREAQEQSAGHESTMGIIDNMGKTCPGGQRLVNGSCVNY